MLRADDFQHSRSLLRLLVGRGICGLLGGGLRSGVRVLPDLGNLFPKKQRFPSARPFNYPVRFIPVQRHYEQVYSAYRRRGYFCTVPYFDKREKLCTKLNFVVNL